MWLSFSLIIGINFFLGCNIDVVRLVANNLILLFIFIICFFIISIILTKELFLRKVLKIYYDFMVRFCLHEKN